MKGPTKKINPLYNQIFPEQDLKHKYKVKKIIGKGQYGYVAKAIRRTDNKFVAIKKLIHIFSNEFEAKRILREIVLLKNCSHPNIVSLIEILLPRNQSLESFDQIYIVTEYCDTDLRKLFKQQDTFLQLEDVKHILYQIVCGIKYLHSASIIHRDLTPSNVLINGQGMEIKICDLGLARVIQHKQYDQQKEIKALPSSEDQNQENVQNDQTTLTPEEKSVRKKQLLNTYEIIDAESFPGTPVDQAKNSKTTSFQNDKDFANLSKSGQIASNKQQQIGSLRKTAGGQNDLSNQQKRDKTNKIEDSSSPKRKGLKRMNSKRGSSSSERDVFQQSSIVGNQKIGEQKSTLLTKPKRQLKRQQGKPNPMAKLTLRVTTRWYRAPQIILLERGYHKPIDIWSLGCLFGQLVKMMKSVCYNSLQRFPLFPGKYCYPVSPATLSNINNQMQKAQESSESRKHDQLFMIISTIGKPTQKEIDFLTDQAAKDYIRQMQNTERKSLKKFFPSMPKEAIEILEQTLKFDPRQRSTIDEILNHPFLDSVRNKDLEKETSAIIMEFEEEQNLSIQKIRKYVANEINGITVK